jgi:hypothetical protein
MNVTRVVAPNGLVYARTEFDSGAVAEELKNAVLVPASAPPMSASLGDTITINYSLVDFDGTPRTDTRDVLLNIAGTILSLAMADGVLAVTIALSALGTIRVETADDVWLEPFEVTVT